VFAQQKAKKKAETAERKDTARRKKALKTKREWLADCQTAFNAMIRERDHDQLCISCGALPKSDSLKGGDWDCSHFFSVGAHPAMRFVEQNAAKSCKKCNREKSGNILNYKAALIRKWGQEEYNKFESAAYQAQPQKYTIDQLQAMTKHYRAKTKQLRNDRI
jgi:hypothetical protein